MQAPLPQNEEARLAALRAYRILNTLPERAYDDIAHLAAYVCRTPMATISLVDQACQWFKSRVGVTASQTPRRVAFCGIPFWAEVL